MSILSWLKVVTSGDSTADFIEANTMTFAEGEEQFQGLDMKAALEAHTAWTSRLEGKLTGKNREELDVATVASDCECTLGKWIHGTARKQFGNSAAYQELQRVHADFHLKAGKILNSVLNDNRLRALESLRELRYQSGNVQIALVRLYAEARH